MATKIYLSGETVIVDKTGETLVKIPQARCHVTFLGDAPDTGDTLVFSQISIKDDAFNVDTIDLVSNVQNSGGTAIGDFAAVLAYIEPFIFRIDTAINPEPFDVNVLGDGFPTSAGTAIGSGILANATGVQYLIAALTPNDTRAKGFDFEGVALANTAVSYTLRFLLNPTIAGTPVYNQLDSTYFDYALGQTGASSTTTVTGGTVLGTVLVSDRIRSGNLIMKGNDFLLDGSIGSFDVLALVVEPEAIFLEAKGAINFKRHK